MNVFGYNRAFPIATNDLNNNINNNNEKKKHSNGWSWLFCYINIEQISITA